MKRDIGQARAASAHGYARDMQGRQPLYRHDGERKSAWKDIPAALGEVQVSARVMLFSLRWLLKLGFIAKSQNSHQNSLVMEQT